MVFRQVQEWEVFVVVSQQIKDQKALVVLFEHGLVTWPVDSSNDNSLKGHDKSLNSHYYSLKGHDYKQLDNEAELSMSEQSTRRSRVDYSLRDNEENLIFMRKT